ncbi:hypothetical protein ACIBBG_14225 [Micromonospora chersina]|uniref:hypothetical protein n=1 Tax=Micromonospora chersina TaxID=47854 RepID=UPI0037A6EEA9
MTSTTNDDKNLTEVKRFFTHNPPRETAPRRPMSPTTRYLCGAAYGSAEFADGVIAELVDDGHRAVVPAIGYDLGPVLRHCYHARHRWLVQNALISAILVLGLFVATWPTVVLLLIAFAAMVMGPSTDRPSGPTWKLVLGAAAVAVVAWLFGRPLLALLFPGTAAGVEYGVQAEETESSAWSFLGWLLAFGLAVLCVIAMTRASVLRILTRDLAPGEQRQPPEISRAPVRRRMQVVTTAQHGNVVLHSGYDPFVGSGQVIHAWSLAMELKRDTSPDGSDPSGSGPVAVDPVALNRHVKHRLAALSSADLPTHERLTGLALRDQIIASGARWRNYPLIDPRLRQPYSYASREAVEAIIRAPQPSVRHFLRASVGAENREVTEAAGDTIMPAEYQNIVVSTFTHLAVEGGMLYVENVSTLLGPLKDEFLDIDQYVAGDETGWEPVRQALTLFGATTVLAPVRLAQAVGRALTANRRMSQADREAERLPRYDFGARAEARQLASARRPVTYLQRLDAEKYSKLMERRISEAVIGYLTDQGIDTSEYETRMNVFNNHGVFIRGDNHGPAAAGPGATALLHDKSGRNKGKDGGDGAGRS